MILTIFETNRFSATDLQPIASQLIMNLLNILQPTTGENEYAIKSLMRVCLSLQDHVEPYLDSLLAKLVLILNSISKNPSKPTFNHYLFETYGVLIRCVCIKNRALIQKFETNLCPTFDFILQQDITGKINI